MKRPLSFTWLTVAGAALFSTHVLADGLDAMSRDDKQWIMPAKNYASTRFSGLNQINAGNAGQLRMAWAFSLGSTHGQEAAPIIVNGTLYVVGAYPNELFALDTTTGDLKIHAEHRPLIARRGLLRCRKPRRGIR